MLKGLLQYVLTLKDAKPIQFGDRQYIADGTISGVKSPILCSLQVATLSGLKDLISNNFESITLSPFVIHVVSPTNVDLIKTASDEWAQRTEYASAVLPETKGFPFGQWLEHENFCIGLQSLFEVTPDLEYLLKIASNVTADLVSTSKDDGVSQETTVKKGVQLKEGITVRNRVCLAPYRTFREVAQPSSEFVFRLQGRDGKLPLCALFEADGGSWKNDAMRVIGEWFRAQVPGVPVIV